MVTFLIYDYHLPFSRQMTSSDDFVLTTSRMMLYTLAENTVTLHAFVSNHYSNTVTLVVKLLPLEGRKKTSCFSSQNTYLACFLASTESAGHKCDCKNHLP